MLSTVVSVEMQAIDRVGEDAYEPSDGEKAYLFACGLC